MKFVKNPFLTLFNCYLFVTCTHSTEVEKVTTDGDTKNIAQKEEYCASETFSPRCLPNEVILMTSAIYGRMRIGRCITAEEVDTLGPRTLGCSTDVLAFFDRKCSGKPECDIRIFDVLLEIDRPCFPAFLSLYLESSFKCITIADEKRSCSVGVSSNPIHIINSRICGTKSQPWTVEAPVGQRISIGIITTNTTDTGQPNEGRNKPPCYGYIVDKTIKRNITICAAVSHREVELYSTAGNTIDVFLEPSLHEDNRKFIMQLKAVGCSDIIPPEDAYLKRTEEEIMIGCYTSRKSWHLYCKSGRWIGVIGNCTQDSPFQETPVESFTPAKGLSSEQVLTITAVIGFTLAVCLTIICFGAVCLKRFYSKRKESEEYKVLKYDMLSAGIQQGTTTRNAINSDDLVNTRLNQST